MIALMSFSGSYRRRLGERFIDGERWRESTLL